ncbi:uncharacterized protein LOC110848334 [Folsomia candida]|uniref:uncharacterized protein LOC110848334 n=1 Tax=Folsomia candida TaxID=158441 RepID=UPI000B8F1D88|nr:uncharacterized protein LOC110848334 [Folsomia candida]
MVKEKRACYGCLNLGHRFNECRNKRVCKKKARIPKPRETNESEEEEKEEEIQKIEQIQSSYNGGRIGYLVCPVVIESAKGPVDGFVVLDSLSSITTMSDATAEQLGLKGPAEPLSVKGINSTAKYPMSQKFKLHIHHKEDNASFPLQVKTMPKLDLPSQSLPQSVLSKYKHLQGLGIQPYDDVRPTLIIGMDHPHLHVHLEHRMGRSPNAPIAVRTKLGWMVIGNLNPYNKQHYSFLMREEDDLHHIVKDFMSNESFGTLPSNSKPRNKEDVRAQSILDSTLRRVQDGWEVGLLWREDDVTLPDSKPLALHRLMQMERKMDRDATFANQYVTRIEEYVGKGFARKLSPEETTQVTPKTNYLPHFMAYNPKKPKKRFVFDAAAKVRGKSLNDLLQGPDKMASLPGILLKFRQRPIGITADIEDMFHRVRVRKEDTQAQRFLWRALDRTREPDEYEMGVLIFGATCSPACAQEAKDRNAAEFQHQLPQAYDAIVKKHYVDALLDSTNTVEEAIQLQQQTCEVQLKGGFKLRNWLSNSVEVMASIPEDLRASSMKNLDMSDVQIERILGMFWKPDEDTFTFSMNFLKAHQSVLQGEKIPTKREVLALVMSLYDPLGFLSLFTVKAKLIIQRARKNNIGWDDPIPVSAQEHWNSWLTELKSISNFIIPRCYSPILTTSKQVQLHIFGDAGEEAYGAVAYLRISGEDEVTTTLVMAKSKVAPLKQLSIPRLELQAAVIGARIAKFITEELEVPLSKTIYWSDSSTVLHWIRAEGRRYQQFVGHRVGEIHELTSTQQWRWIPTHENVADEMTRISKKSEWG